MGLDMYLKRKVYVGNKYRKPEQQIRVVLPEKEEDVTFPVTYINQEKISEITEDAGYWRKINCVHEWFVENVQNGEDDCKEYFVEREQLEELLLLVVKVLNASELVEGDIKNGQVMKDGKMVDNIVKGKYIKDPTVAKELLPSQEGFFFGGTDYDEWYYRGLVETKEILEKALSLEEGDYYYRASW